MNTERASVAATPRSVSALRLVTAAERLFALNGINGVSLRQVAAEAGSANNSAVHYHFRSKDALITAIFEHRLPQIVRERRLLATRDLPHDVRSRVEAHFLPVLDLAEATDNYYVSFVEQLQRADVQSVGHLVILNDDGQRSNEEFRTDLDRLLDPLPQPMRRMRIQQAQLFCLHAAADRERAVARGDDLPSFPLFVSSLFDGITGFLTAPASATTLRKVATAPEAESPGLRLL
jgi:AcrR family transcriptional regulator